jgi:multidrug resistance efflux pump
VRTNLGITFATAQRRSIQQTLRAPGRFEYLPTATRAYRTMLPGRVDVLVEQFEHVEEGTPLYRIDAPAWRDMQQAIAQADATVIRLHTTASTFGHQLRAHQRHEESLQDSIAIWNRRIERLEALREAGGGRLSEFTTAQTSLASAQADLASAQEKDAELLASRLQTEAAMQAAKAEQSLALDAAAAVLGLDVDALIAPSSNVSDAPPTWRAIKTIEVKATAPGVVASIDLTLGAWADAQAPVVTVVQPDRLRFHATGLQSDLGVLQSGLRVSIVPPTPTLTGTAVPMDSVMHGTLALGLSGDPDERTIDLYVTPDELAPWARSGVSAQLEIVTNGSAAQELAIPLAAVQRDGLMPVIFRRAPDNANEAIRIEADLGLDDGRWVVVRSGLRDGDEVVLDGGFQLMLATSGAVQKGGHFHSDGTFHEGEH